MAEDIADADVAGNAAPLVRSVLQFGVGDVLMWLFTGRCAHFGPAICSIAAGVASVAVVYLLLAARLMQRHDLLAVLVTAIGAAVFSESEGFAEPVFASNHLTLGSAMFLALFGILLGLGAVLLSRKLRLLRTLILVAASAILLGDLLGDLAGWLRRSAGPSKFEVHVRQLPEKFLIPFSAGPPHKL